MECNKEEAIKARCIAEKKMQCKDFVGARKFALKAQQLFPDLEYISQMLTVCEMHCSAETKVNGSEDLYRILQVETTADEFLIKKQYRKLALLLHPDKNKFPGAEAAFKLVVEAHRTLSDQAKRSVYDLKRKATIPAVGRRPPPHQPNVSSNARKQPPVPNIYQNNATTPLTRQQTQTTYSAQTFWTVCPSCGTRYQYYRTIINKALCCQHCSKPFIAYESNAQGMPPGLNSDHSLNQFGIRQCKDSQGQCAKSSSQQSKSRVDPCNSGVGSAVPEPVTRVFGTKNMFGEGSGNKTRDNSPVENEVRKENEVKFEKVKFEKVNKGGPVRQSSGNPSWKHRRKVVAESSDSDSSDSEEIIIEESEHAAAWGAEVTGCSPRRSTRQRHNVSYIEDSSSDDDFENLTNSDQLRKEFHNDDQSDKASSEDDVVEVQAPTNATNVFKSELKGRKRGSMATEEDKPNGHKLRKGFKVESEGLQEKNGSKGISKDSSNSISDSSASKLNSGTLSYPDPEFHDFDQDRDQTRFAIDQIWALYDDLDGMPRFYAQIRSVSSTGFKLCFTWLEYDPVGQAERDWSDQELPVGCGKFMHGKTENTENSHLFSHLMPINKNSKMNFYFIYPRKGEVWALFKGWDIKWSSNPDQHRQFEYEFVEILSDFALGSGVNAIPLAKVKGFVSLFCQGGSEEICTLHIPPSELLRFSHVVPSYRTTGKEREGIPEGFYELDPASLPTNFEHTFNSVTLDEVRVKAELGGRVAGAQCFNSRTTERISTNDLENVFSLRNAELTKEKIGIERSPEGNDISAEAVNGTYANAKKHNRANGSHSTADETERNVGERGPSECLVNEEESHLDAPGDGSKNVMENSNGSVPEPSSPIESDYPDSEFYNFNSERTTEKIQTGQIWALYCEDDGFPKYYALVRKFDSEHFKVCVTWLEACPVSEEEMKWSDNDLPLACGRFRLCCGTEANEEYGSLKYFSHVVQAEPVGKRRYDIYPQVNEVWAVYKNWNAEWKISDLKKCSEKGEYEFVEILPSFASMVTVMILEKVDGFKPVFRPRSDNGVPNTMEIPRNEFLRFSHRIPSIRLTEERGGGLCDYWELDPASVPETVLSTSSD